MTEMLKKALTGNKNKLKFISLLILFVLWFLWQYPDIFNAPWEMYDSWRQGDTYSIALNYYQYDMNFLKPQFNYDGAEGTVVQLELQIVPYICAVIFKLIGFATPVIPRIVNLFLFLGSAVFLYLIMKRFVSFLPAFFGLVLYLFVPINLLYARAIMPEACALFFLCGGIWFLQKFYFDDRKASLWISAVFVALAIVEKTPTIFVGILCIAVFFWKMGKKAFISYEFYGFGLITLGLPLIYYLYSSSVATACFVDSIAAKHIFSSKLLSVFTKEAMVFFKENLGLYFGLPLMLGALLGFVLTFRKDRRFILVLTLSFILELATIVAIIKFNYYLIFISPIVCVLNAVFFEELYKIHKILFLPVMLIVLVLTLNQSAEVYGTYVKEDLSVKNASEFIDESIPKGEPVSISAINPIYHNAANRRGYRANIKYYEHIPKDPQGETDYFISQGISYFAVIEGTVYDDWTGEYLLYLEENFKIFARNEFCTIYKLEKE